MMRGFLTIAKKDLRSFFLSPVFYILAAFCAVVFSTTFPIHLKQYVDVYRDMTAQSGMAQNQMSIHYMVFIRQLSYLNLLLIVLVPAFTMGLLSEEKKLHTFDLLLTSPVSSAQIVLGKFASALGAISVLVLMAFAYCAWAGFFATFSWPLLITSFVGLILIGAVYAAVDLFCSSLTESALISFGMGIVLNLMGWFIGMGAEVSETQLGRQFFEHVSLVSHLTAFLEGTVRTSALVFIFSVIGLFIFLAERVVESNRWR